VRILKYILLFFALLILLFLGYGSEVSVNKSIQEAWRISQDESKYPLWLDGFKSMELLSGERYKEGSTYKIIINPGDGQPDFEMIETLVSIKENESVEMHFDSEMIDFK